MRILIVQDFLRDGGTERQTLVLCEHLRRAGHALSLVTFRPGGRLAVRVERAGVDSRPLQSFDWRLNFAAPGLFRTVEELSPDVVLCMGRMANCYAGLLKKRFADVVVVGSIRTGKRLPWLNLWSFRQTDAVIANCDWWKEELAARRVPASKIEVILNALRAPGVPGRRAEARHAIREALGAAPSTMVMINVASFRPGKRHAWLIESLGALDCSRDWQLWLVGDGATWRHCRKLADERGLGERVRFLGYRPDPGDLYAAADVAVSASLEDSLSNFLIEAQGAGLPVVAADYRGACQAFADGESGYLVSPVDRGELVACLERLFRDARLRREMGERGIRFAGVHFSSERQGDKVLSLFARLLPATPRQPSYPSIPTPSGQRG